MRAVTAWEDVLLTARSPANLAALQSDATDDQVFTNGLGQSTGPLNRSPFRFRLSFPARQSESMDMRNAACDLKQVDIPLPRRGRYDDASRAAMPRGSDFAH
jgi:hypothetical protein